jgi:hypothetical protein
VTASAAALPQRISQQDGAPFAVPQATRLFYLVVAVGVGLRLATLATPHIFYPDEIFQYLEAAHRLVFGAGVVPWEYREHIRSWLFPLFLAGPMWLGGAAAPSTGAYLVLPKLVLLAFSTSAIWAAHSLGRRFSPLHGLFAALVAATWYESVYFSTVALTEPVATSAFLAGAALLYRRRDSRTGYFCVTAGGLFAVACLIRFQYAPAVAAFALIETARKPREIAYLLAGAAPILLLSCAADLAMGSMPFGWLVENVRQNILLGRSSLYGVSTWLYPLALIGVWKLWLMPILLLCWIGARRYPALMLAALANFAVHSLIGHKEYRFILLTTTLISILAAIGTVDAVQWLVRRSGGDRARQIAWIAAGGWLLASASIAAAPPVRQWWTQQQAQLAAFAALRDAPEACGIAIYGFDWSETPGYTYLHRPVPLYVYDLNQRNALMRDAPAFNRILQPATLAPAQGFAPERCFSRDGGPPICVYRRSRKCHPADREAAINRRLIQQRR